MPNLGIALGLGFLKSGGAGALGGAGATSWDNPVLLAADLVKSGANLSKDTGSNGVYAVGLSDIGHGGDNEIRRYAFELIQTAGSINAMLGWADDTVVLDTHYLGKTGAEMAYSTGYYRGGFVYYNTPDTVAADGGPAIFALNDIITVAIDFVGPFFKIYLNGVLQGTYNLEYLAYSLDRPTLYPAASIANVGDTVELVQIGLTYLPEGYIEWGDLTSTGANTWHFPEYVHSDYSVADAVITKDSNDGTWKSAMSATGRDRGKFAYELVWDEVGTFVMMGLAERRFNTYVDANYLGQNISAGDNSIGYQSNGTVYYNGLSQGSTSWASFAIGDIITIAVDFEELNVTFYNDGVLVDSYALLDGFAMWPWYPAISALNVGTKISLIETGLTHLPSGYYEWGDFETADPATPWDSDWMSSELDIWGDYVSRQSGYDSYGTVLGSTPQSSGKKTVEFHWLSGASAGTVIGLGNHDMTVEATHPGQNSANSDNSIGIYSGGTVTGNLNSIVNDTSPGAVAVGSIITAAIDFTAETVDLYKNGVAQGTGSYSFSTVADKVFYPAVGMITTEEHTVVKLIEDNLTYPVKGHTSWTGTDPFPGILWDPDKFHAGVSVSGSSSTGFKANSRLQTDASGDWQSGMGNIGHDSGKWQFEYMSEDGGTTMVLGIATDSYAYATSAVYPGLDNASANNSIGYYDGGTIYYNLDAGNSFDSGVNTYTASDIITVTVDFTTKEAKFYKNGVLEGTYTWTTEAPTWYITAALINSGYVNLKEEDLDYPVAGFTDWSDPWG